MSSAPILRRFTAIRASAWPIGVVIRMAREGGLGGGADRGGSNMVNAKVMVSLLKRLLPGRTSLR